MVNPYERAWAVRTRRCVAKDVRGMTWAGKTALEAERLATAVKKDNPDCVVEVMFRGRVWMPAGHVSELRCKAMAAGI